MRMTRAPGRVVPPTSDDARVRQATAEELGPDAAASMPQVRASTQASGGDSAEARQPAQPIDEGAAALVQSIAVALAHRPVNAQGMTVISLDELRNYSRAGHGEFNHMLRRMARLLTQAGRERRLEFVADDGAAAGSADQRPHYRMQGAAYLITAAGFDQWELFLSMTPMDRDMTVWDARSATRVLRTEREGVTQMTYPVDRGGGAP
jgi:hypothetical protein